MTDKKDTCILRDRECHFLAGKKKVIGWLIGGASAIVLAIAGIIYAAGGSSAHIKQNENNIVEIKQTLNTQVIPQLEKASDERHSIAIQVEGIRAKLEQISSRPYFDKEWDGWSRIANTSTPSKKQSETHK